VPEKSSLAVRRAEGGYRSMGVFGIHEPRSYREEVGHVRVIWITSNAVVVVVGGEHVMVFLQTLVEKGCCELIWNRTLGRGGRYSRLFRRWGVANVHTKV
jgi:hypothetical protein